MKHRKSVAPPLAVGTVAAAVLTITSFGTYAALTSEVNNTTPQGVPSGTLILGLTNAGVGFSQNVSDLAPGDTVNRYVELTNSGTLAGRALSLNVASNVASTGDEVLISDGPGDTTKALTLTAEALAVTTKPGNATVTASVTFEWWQGGTWDTGTNTCSSNTVVPLGSSTGPTTFTTVVTHSVGVGERVALRATTPQNRRTDLTTTVSLSASRASAPPPMTTSS